MHSVVIQVLINFIFGKASPYFFFMGTLSFPNAVVHGVLNSLISNFAFCTEHCLYYLSKTLELLVSGSLHVALYSFVCQCHILPLSGKNVGRVSHFRQVLLVML